MNDMICLNQVIFSKSNKYLFMVGNPGVVLAWDFNSNEGGKVKKIIEFKSEIRSMVFSYDGKYLLCGEKDDVVHMLHSEKGFDNDLDDITIETFNVESRNIAYLACSPSCEMIGIATWDGKISFFNVVLGKITKEIYPIPQKIMSFRYIWILGMFLALGSENDKKMRLFNAWDEQLLVGVQNDNDPFYIGDISLDGGTFVTNSDYDGLWIYNVGEGARELNYLQDFALINHFKFIWSERFVVLRTTRTGDKVFACYEDEIICIDGKRNKKLYSIKITPYCLNLSSDDEFFVTSDRYTTKVYKLEAGEMVNQIDIKSIN